MDNLKEEKLYTCTYCGNKLPYSKLWFIDNKKVEGICYKKECIAKSQFVDTDIDWDSL
jgi:hypothetical protein